jgi:UPF0755 protein
MASRKKFSYSSRPTHAARAVHAKGDKKFRTYDTSQIIPKKGKAPLILAIALSVIVLGAIVWGVFAFLNSSNEVLGEGESAQITVAEGATVRDIADQLKEVRLINDTGEFIARVSALEASSSLKPGAYLFYGNTAQDDIIAQLIAGPNALQDTVTIPEGFTLAQTALRIEKAYAGKISAEEFSAAAQNAQAYVADYPFVANTYNNSLEGFLFPKTYEVREGASAEDVVRQMLDQFKTEIDTLNLEYPTGRGLSVYDVVKLASVVEKEAATENREEVASVFYNRLSADMALQSDATTAYVIGADPTPEDLQVDGPFNTYLNKGLPAGAICSPGLAALAAVCYPSETNYFYFYFKEVDGEMRYYFSETYEEHNNAIFGT